MKVRKIVLIAVLFLTIVPLHVVAVPRLDPPIPRPGGDLMIHRGTFARLLETLRRIAVAVEKDDPALAKRIMKGYDTAVRLDMLGSFDKASEHLRNEIIILAHSEIGQVRQGIRQMIAILTNPPEEPTEKTLREELEDAKRLLGGLIEAEKAVIREVDRLRKEDKKNGKPLGKADIDKRDRDLSVLEEEQRRIGKKIDDLSQKLPNTDKLDSARGHAKKSGDNFAKAGSGGRGKPGGGGKAIAGGRQEAGKVRDDLNDVLKNMEDRLRNLDQQKAVLDTKEALTRILKEQEAIKAGTRQASLVWNRKRADLARIAALGRSQGTLGRRVAKLAANTKLRETSVVLPWMLEQVGSDMSRVGRMIFRKGVIRIGKSTQEMQDGIVRDLKALIKALEDKAKELAREEERVKPKPPRVKKPPKPEPEPQKKKKRLPLLSLSELRILKYMEEQLRDRTAKFRRTHPQPAKYTWQDAESIRGMSLRQKQIRTLSLQLIAKIKKAVEEYNEEKEPEGEDR